MSQTQKLLDKVTLAQDDSLEQMKTQGIVKDSPFILNGTISIVGNIGSGKTSLIAKLLVIYSTVKKDDLDIFYFHNGIMDGTMAENINKYKLKIVSITGQYMEEFIKKYRALKTTVIELYKYLVRDDYWSETLTEIKNNLSSDSILPFAKEMIKKHSVPSELKIDKKSFAIKAIIDLKSKDIVPSLMVFDDITQFKGFTGKYANSFFKELTANTRHFCNTSIFSMQRFTYLQKDVRVLSNTWCLGYGIAEDDIKDLFKQSIAVGGYSTNELIQLYNKVEKYNFLTINSGMEKVEYIKVNL